MRFQPGSSGNPGGRPKAVIEAKKLAASRSKEYVQFWFDRMKEGGRDAEVAVRELSKIAGLYSGELVDVEDGAAHILARFATLTTEQLLELKKNGAQ